MFIVTIVCQYIILAIAAVALKILFTYGHALWKRINDLLFLGLNKLPTTHVQEITSEKYKNGK